MARDVLVLAPFTLRGGGPWRDPTRARLAGREEESTRCQPNPMIPLVGRHCGGEKGRRMMLNTGTGAVTIEIVGEDPIEI